jgi:hypothetical protein
MSDAIDDPAIVAAATRVMKSSASGPSSERFRLQLDQELRNAGIALSADDLDAVQQAVVEHRM